MKSLNRRQFIHHTAYGAIALGAMNSVVCADSAPASIRSEIAKQHDQNLQRLGQWIRQASIAAENRGVPEGCDFTIELLRQAGFQRALRVATDGQPGIFATLDAGAPKTVGLYFMYDVKQVDPAEWSSPPWDGALVDKPRLGKVMVGRGTVNQKGPQSAVLAALHAMRGAGVRCPVNLVLVAEGEEEIGSPHFHQIVQKPEVQQALSRCTGIFMPSASQDLDGTVTISLGAKGVVELQLKCSGELWGRGPRKDIHSANKARVDSPAWHLVHALATMTTADGNEPAVEGFADKARPISAAEKAMVAEGARRLSEAQAKKLLEVDRWIDNAPWEQALERLVSRPTVNIQGLVGGYTGPGGKTVLPHQAIAKLDLRLVPDMKAQEALAALKAHLAKHGFGDIEVRMTGGYDPNSTPADSAFIAAQSAVYRRHNIEPLMWPRSAGSWPGYLFTNPPLRLPAGHFGLGHGSGAHAPDEYYLIESSNPKIEGLDGAVYSFAEYLFQLGTA